MNEVNKFGVPHNQYRLFLKDGDEFTIDIGDEGDWGNIQQMLPTDFVKEYPSYCDDIPGWGNDSDGHIEIVAVKDNETDEFISVREWAKYVWSFVNNYAQ